MPQGMAYGQQEAEASTALSAAVTTRAPGPPVAVLRPAPVARAEAAEGRRRRWLSCLPALLSWGLITALVWGPLVAPKPLVGLVIAFNLYWLWRSYDWCYHAFWGSRLLRRHAAIDWRRSYEEARAGGRGSLDWEDIYHVVLIPNYCEALATLQRTLEGLARCLEPRKLLVVLAMEEREGPPAQEKASQLQEEFQGAFGGLFATFHPSGLPGEVPGKSSNMAWAGRWAYSLLVEGMGYRLDYLTLTCCDADTRFHPGYFSCLTYKFATDPQRYRRFWQAPLFYYNNIWDVPAPLRLLNAHSGLYFLSVFSRRWLRLLFPQSTYSTSFRMAHEVDYWDADVIPEDWHMFLKSFFHLGGQVDVDTIYLPLTMDAVRAQGYLRNLLCQYRQTRRHAWGCSDIPYALGQFLAHREIPLGQRLPRLWVLWENHTLWATQWFFITVGWQLPTLVSRLLGLEGLPGWFPLVTGLIFVPTLLPLLGLVLLDQRLRPPRPAHFRRWLLAVQYGCYILMAPLTLLFTALPALDAQTRLALGRPLTYQVAEKG